MSALFQYLSVAYIYSVDSEVNSEIEQPTWEVFNLLWSTSRDKEGLIVDPNLLLYIKNKVGYAAQGIKSHLHIPITKNPWEFGV